LEPCYAPKFFEAKLGRKSHPGFRKQKGQEELLSP
jgi:hypothetical protein